MFVILSLYLQNFKMLYWCNFSRSFNDIKRFYIYYIFND